LPDGRIREDARRQVEEILKLVENAMDVLRQVVWALESLRARLDEETKDGGP